MRILVLGGTQFVGRALVEAALAAGDELTLFHRGRTNPGLFPEVEHVLGDRDGGLAALDGRTWDACIDVSGYLPRLVGDSATALRDSVERYVYVSTISVYADLAVPRDESGPLATLDDETTEEIGGGTYGALKALCEHRVTETFGERAAIVRPGFIIGPYDHTGRFPWWAHRAARGGEMIVPASLARAFQAIDTRDLADFLLLRARSPLTGVFNATGPVPPGDDARPRRGGGERERRGSQRRGGRRRLPHGQGIETSCRSGSTIRSWAAWAQVDVGKAIGAGLRFRPIDDTVAATLAHTEIVPGLGLEPEREAELLAAWHAGVRLKPHQASSVCSSRNAFSAMITIATTTAAAVVERRLTSPPISARLRQNMTSGISANGIPNDSTTWLRISAFEGLTPDRDDHERRHHRDRPPQRERDLALDEALHHDLAGHRADARRREARREQGDAEHDRRARAEVGVEAVVDGVEVVADVVEPARMEDRRGGDQHAHVDQARDRHRDHDVDELEPEDPLPRLRRRPHDARWVSAECR